MERREGPGLQEGEEQGKGGVAEPHDDRPIELEIYNIQVTFLLL